VANDPFNIITSYCVKNNKPFATRNHAYCIFVQALEDAVQQMGVDTPRARENASAALLTETNIQNFMGRAELFSDEVLRDTIRTINKRRQLREYWFAIITGVLANIVFSVFLLLMFWIGRDQITQWLSSLQGHAP
jgi:hypothetical protein